MRRSLATWFTSAVVALSLGLAFLLRPSGPSGAAPSAEAARAVVEARPLQRRAVPGEARAGGFLRARHDVVLSAERPARLLSFPHAEGAHVRRGDVLVHLDDTAPAARLEQATIAYREAALDPHLAASELARTLEMLRLAEYEVRLHHPVAPFDGVIERHRVEEGEFVGLGAPLVDLVDPRHLLLDVEVDAEILGALREGGEAHVRVKAVDLADSGGGDARPARITLVTRRADPSTRRYRVELELASEPGENSEPDVAWGAIARPGMYAEAAFGLPPGPPALYLPKATVRNLLGDRGIYLVVEGRARWRPVRVAEVRGHPELWRLDERDLDLVDLGEAPAVIVGGFSGVRDGSLVEIRE